MEQVWRRIESWLGEHAPEALRALHPPATAETIEWIEGIVGAPLPEDFRQSMRIHGGQTRDLAVFAPWELIEPARMVQRWRLHQQGAQEAPYPFPVTSVGPVRAVWWNRLWIPCANNGSGNDLCLDLDPAEGGDRGQIVEYVHDLDLRTVVSPSFRAWLSAVADDMEHGHYEGSSLGFPTRKR